MNKKTHTHTHTYTHTHTHTHMHTHAQTYVPFLPMKDIRRTFWRISIGLGHAIPA